jgi:predicted PurR-regulated permease PerM
MYISYDVLNFFIYLLGALALIVAFFAAIIIIITFININKLVKRVDKLVKNNDDSINKTVKVLPEVVNNVNDVSLGLKKGIDKATGTIEVIEDSLCETVTAVSAGTEGFFDFISIAGEVVKAVLKIFPLGKKK